MENSAENKKVVSDYLSAVEKKDFENVKAFLTEDHFFHISLSPMPLDSNGHIQALKRLFEGFPDLNYTIENQIAEESKVAIRGTLTGTHAGEFNGIPPTNRKINISFSEIVRLKDGKIAEEWAQMDTMSLMKQIGGVS